MSCIKFFLHIPLMPSAESSFESCSLSPFQLSIGYFQMSLVFCTAFIVAPRIIGGELFVETPEICHGEKSGELKMFQ